jgi:DNA-directed RNA polymerase subunit omega
MSSSPSTIESKPAKARQGSALSRLDAQNTLRFDGVTVTEGVPMARVTVEDCVQRVPNRFDLVMLAAQRARNIGAGSPVAVDVDNDKNPVIALREIADGLINLEDLERNLIQGLQKVVEVDEPVAEDLDLRAIQEELGEEGAEPEATDEMAENGLHLEGEDAEEIVEGEELGPSGLGFDVGDEDREGS